MYLFFFICILGIQYLNSDKIMVTADLFLSKEFDTFVKNGIFGKFISF